MPEKEHRLAFTFFKGSCGPAVSVIAAVLFFYPPLCVAGLFRRGKRYGNEIYNQKTGASILIVLLVVAAARPDGSGALESWWQGPQTHRGVWESVNPPQADKFANGWRMSPLEAVQRIFRLWQMLIETMQKFVTEP